MESRYLFYNDFFISSPLYRLLIHLVYVSITNFTFSIQVIIIIVLYHYSHILIDPYGFPVVMPSR